MVPSTIIFSLVVFWSKISWSSQETSSLQEEQSRILNQLLEKYDHRIIPYNNNQTDEFDNVSISVNWIILHMSDVSDFDWDFSIEFLFKLEWTDERLKYEDTGKIRYLTLTDTSKVWVPDLFFHNEKDAHQHKIMKPNMFYRIYPSGKVVYSTRLSLTMWCNMELENYPFDNQHCSVRLLSYAYTTRDVVLLWDKVVPIYITRKVSNTMGSRLRKIVSTDCSINRTTGDFTCLRAEFYLKRDRLEYYILHTFLPTTLLVILSWTSFWIDRREVVARTILVLATLFAMSSFSTSTSSAVPYVSSVKAMDVWVGTCFTFLLMALFEFGVVSSIGSSEDNADSKAEEGSVHVVQNPNSSQDSLLEHKFTKTASFRGHKTFLRLPKDSRRIDSAASILFPAAFLTFVLFYIIIYCVYDSSKLNYY